MLRGVIEVQRYFRGHRARRLLHELNKGAKSIQSCISSKQNLFPFYITSTYILPVHILLFAYQLTDLFFPMQLSVVKIYEGSMLLSQIDAQHLLPNYLMSS